MNSKEIIIDPNNFIPDRYFSYKGRSALNMDMYKDGGRIMPLIPPVRHHLEMSAHYVQASKSKSCSVSPQKTREPSKDSLPKVSSNKRSRIPAQQPIIVPQVLVNSSSQVQEDKGATPVGAPQKDVPQTFPTEQQTVIQNPAQAMQRSYIYENLSVIFTPEKILERSKKLMRELETPDEIYKRLIDQNLEKGNDGNTRTGLNRLKMIVKKLDLSVEVGSSAVESKRVNDMKKIPIEYFKKAREAKHRGRLNQTVDVGLKNGEMPKIFINLDESKVDSHVSQNITSEDLNLSTVTVQSHAIQGTGDMTPSGEEQTMITRAQRSETPELDKKKMDYLKPGNRLFKSCVVNPKSRQNAREEKALSLVPEKTKSEGLKLSTLTVHSCQSQEDTPLMEEKQKGSPNNNQTEKTPKIDKQGKPSCSTLVGGFTKSCMADSRYQESFRVRSLSPNMKDSMFAMNRNRRIEIRKRVEQEKEQIKKELRSFNKMSWITDKISLLDQEVTNLKGEANDYLGLIRTTQSESKKEAKKLIEGIDRADEQQEIERDCYEDALLQKNNRIIGASFLLKNCTKTSHQIKNKRERDVDYIRFEKQMARVEKKAHDKLRSRTPSHNPRKQLVSLNTERAI